MGVAKFVVGEVLQGVSGGCRKMSLDGVCRRDGGARFEAPYHVVEGCVKDLKCFDGSERSSSLSIGYNHCNEPVMGVYDDS